MKKAYSKKQYKGISFEPQYKSEDYQFLLHSWQWMNFDEDYKNERIVSDIKIDLESSPQSKTILFYFNFLKFRSTFPI